MITAQASGLAFTEECYSVDRSLYTSQFPQNEQMRVDIGDSIEGEVSEIYLIEHSIDEDDMRTLMSQSATPTKCVYDTLLEMRPHKLCTSTPALLTPYPTPECGNALLDTLFK